MSDGTEEEDDLDNYYSDEYQDYTEHLTWRDICPPNYEEYD